jgi:hypothetical protein
VLTGDLRVLALAFGPFESLVACGWRVVREVHRRFPCDDPAIARRNPAAQVAAAGEIVPGMRTLRMFADWKDGRRGPSGAIDAR